MNKEDEIRYGLQPIITPGDIPKDRDTIRTWVTSEKRPFLPYDGFRLLTDTYILQWRKSWWIFGRWIKIWNRADFDQIWVLDEGYVR